MNVGVITNPNSRKNKGRHRHSTTLQGIVGPFGEVRETPSPDALKPVLRDFLRRDVPLWVSDGGDGALHWMLRSGLEVLAEDEFAGRQLPVTMPTNGGTIDFVAGNVGIKGSAESILARLRERFERGEPVESVAVKSMLIEGIEEIDGEQRSFSTIGFAAAVGGIGQRFFAKYYAADDPCPKEIVKVLAKTVLSFPVASSPLRHLPGMPAQLGSYATEMFKPTVARVSIDGRELPQTRFTGMNIASMSINLGGVLRFFSEADQPDQLHALCSTSPPWQIIANLPRMYLGKSMAGDEVYDGPARELTVEAIGDELLAPLIDGECYENLRQLSFKLGPRLRIARVVGNN